MTVCTQNRLCFFDNPDVRDMIESVWQGLPKRFPNIELDEWVVMPNHFHGIITIIPSEQKGDHKDRPYETNENPTRRGESCIRPHGTKPDSIGRIIQAFKSITTFEYTRGVKEHGWAKFPKHLWQRNYYEHVIRNDEELNEIRQYIRTNPENWKNDNENSKWGLYGLAVRGEG